MSTRREPSTGGVGLRVTYNAPVALTFALLMVVFFLLDSYIFPGLVERFFTLPGRGEFRWSVTQIPLLLTYSLGHFNWTHLSGNITFILLLGPILEERFGSMLLLLMIVGTSVCAGLFNVLLAPSRLLGASGIVFMMITLVSMVRIRRHEIPLTLIVIFFLYLFQEILSLFSSDQISQVTHIIGGVCGAVFGFLLVERKGQPKNGTPSALNL